MNGLTSLNNAETASHSRAREISFCRKVSPGTELRVEQLLNRVNSPRTRAQMLCMAMFKDLRLAGGGWNEAAMLWVEQGCAKRFADFYRDGVPLSQLYRFSTVERKSTFKRRGYSEVHEIQEARS